ncbi:hypothetical protein F5Y06DRAFT_277351 [Hypoxylon sp. FL0890]|nr:hypothetical protein F5Y06DRAFT_277351 [Hypoxylon sp. FL0890]
MRGAGLYNGHLLRWADPITLSLPFFPNRYCTHHKRRPQDGRQELFSVLDIVILVLGLVLGLVLRLILFILAFGVVLVVGVVADSGSLGAVVACAAARLAQETVDAANAAEAAKYVDSLFAMIGTEQGTRTLELLAVRPDAFVDSAEFMA